jgi:hypothetical protein
MENKIKNNISGFFQGFRQGNINYNLESLALYANEIKGQCESLNIDPSKYKNLSSIKKDEDIGSWVAFGNYVIGRIELNKLDKGSLKELTYNYLKMAQIPGHAYLEKAAEDLGKLVVGSEEK